MIPWLNWIEHLTTDQKVGGSSPSGIARKSKPYRDVVRLFCFVRLQYDFGSNKGGTMVDLAMKINNCTFHEAMKKLEGNETPFFPTS